MALPAEMCSGKAEHAEMRPDIEQEHIGRAVRCEIPEFQALLGIVNLRFAIDLVGVGMAFEEPAGQKLQSFCRAQRKLRGVPEPLGGFRGRPEPIAHRTRNGHADNILEPVGLHSPSSLKPEFRNPGGISTSSYPFEWKVA